MAGIDLGPVGMALNVSDDESYLAEAAELEQLGYSAIWVSGGQLASLEPLAKLVRGTWSASVVPGIIPLGVHDVAAVTELYADLEAAHPGRFIAGLGSPQEGPSPLRATEEFLDELDEADPPLPAARRLLAALGPRKLALARERFAGAVTLLVTPEFTRHAREVLGQDATLVVNLVTVLDPNADRARRTARGTLRFLLGVGGYAAHARRLGFTDDEIADVSDRVVDELAVWGDEDTIAARFDEHHAAGADHVVFTVLAEGDQPSTMQVAKELATLVIR